MGKKWDEGSQAEDAQEVLVPLLLSILWQGEILSICFVFLLFFFAIADYLIDHICSLLNEKTKREPMRRKCISWSKITKAVGGLPAADCVCNSEVFLLLQ